MDRNNQDQDDSNSESRDEDMDSYDSDLPQNSDVGEAVAETLPATKSDSERPYEDLSDSDLIRRLNNTIGILREQRLRSHNKYVMTRWLALSWLDAECDLRNLGEWESYPSLKEDVTSILTSGAGVRALQLLTEPPYSSLDPEEENLSSEPRDGDMDDWSVSRPIDENTVSGEDAPRSDTATELDQAFLDTSDKHLTSNLESTLLSLASYEDRITRNNSSLGSALALYRQQLEAGVATGFPLSITPNIIGKSLISGPLTLFQNIFEHLRNAFIFIPVLWTWLQIGLAIGANTAIMRKAQSDLDVYAFVKDKTFLDLWAVGFKMGDVYQGEPFLGLDFIKAEKFETTALIAVAFIFALVIMTLLVGILRSANTASQKKYELEFAGILGQCSFFHLNIKAETPQEQIFEFSRIGRQLTDSIQTLTTAFQAETASMSSAIQSAQASAEQSAEMTKLAAEQSAEMTKSAAEQSAEMAKAQFELVNNSVGAMNTSMTTLTSLIDKQADQLGTIVESLSDVSDLADRLNDIREEFTEATTSLGKIERELGPAANTMTDSVRLLNNLITKIDQASANLGSALLKHDNFSKKMDDAAESINLVSNRFLDLTKK